MEFIEIIKKYFGYRKEYDRECLFSTYGVNLKELFNKFKSLVQKKCKCTDYENSLLCDAEHNESRFVEFMYNYFQRYLSHFPENIRDELEKINKEFYELYMKKQEIYNSYKIQKISDVAEMEKNWFLVKSKYCEVYSLLFFKEIITDEFKVVFFRKCLEWVENNEETKFNAFYQLVTSKSFMENKMSNALLEKSLQIDNVDKLFEEKCRNKSNRGYYVEPIIFGLLTSKAYYEGKITEESLEILFDENYRVIKIMIALLMFSEDYTKDKKFSSAQVQEGQNNMELIIALLNYSKKEELCEMFESAIIPSPHSKVKHIPTFESSEDRCSFNAKVLEEYYSCEGKIYNPLDFYFDPIGDAAIITRIDDVTDGKVVLNVDVHMHYPCLKYNPIARLMYDIRDWLCTERVLPFATRPLIKTLEDKK